MISPPVFTYQSEGWILDEDRALRDHMKGVWVRDHEKSARPVEVWFGHPDQELREQKYPYITIDLLQVQEGLDRVHRGDLYLSDPPPWWGLEPLTGSQIGYLLEMPTPIDLDYQISTWSRNPRHDRQIITQIMTGGRIPPRGGLLWTVDGKNRRLDFMGHVKRDLVEDGKRLLNNVYRVRVSSEIPWGAISWDTTGSPSTPSFPLVPVTGVNLSIEGLLRGNRISYDRTAIRRGTVTSYDPSARTASVVVGADTVDRVPVLSYLGVLGVGEEVAVGRDPAPDSQTGYRYVVLGREYRTEQ